MTPPDALSCTLALDLLASRSAPPDAPSFTPMPMVTMSWYAVGAEPGTSVTLTVNRPSRPPETPTFTPLVRVCDASPDRVPYPP